MGVQNLPGRGGPGTIQLPLITSQLLAGREVPSPPPAEGRWTVSGCPRKRPPLLTASAGVNYRLPPNDGSSAPEFHQSDNAPSTQSRLPAAGRPGIRPRASAPAARCPSTSCPAPGIIPAWLVSQINSFSCQDYRVSPRGRAFSLFPCLFLSLIYNPLLGQGGGGGLKKKKK